VPFDLSTYCARLGVGQPARPDLASLRALHLAHIQAIPFENLDVQMGLPVRLDVDSLQKKLVARRRGGYCFEQNTLFLHALRASGFEAMACEARVRHGAGTVLPRTHMLLVVRLEGRDWLCDVGFGASGLLEPAPLDGEERVQYAWTYRVRRDGAVYALQWRQPSGWEDLYAFEAAERYPVDFEMASWFTSTWPESRFVLTLTAQRSTPEVRYTLRNLTYTEDRGDTVDTRTVAREEVVPLLRTVFDLDVPDAVRFRGLD
jgi:N-hydroxyarylamine O-acetyltransferase